MIIRVSPVQKLKNRVTVLEKKPSVVAHATEHKTGGGDVLDTYYAKTLHQPTHLAGGAAALDMYYAKTIHQFSHRSGSIAPLDTYYAKTIHAYTHKIGANDDVGATTAYWNATMLQGVKVNTTAPADRDVLTYDDGNAYWKPSAVEARGYVLEGYHGLWSPADSTTYYVTPYLEDAAPTTATAGQKCWVVPKSGTIKAMGIDYYILNSTGTTEAVLVYIRINGATDVTAFNQAMWDSAGNGSYIVTNLNQAVTAGDRIEIKIVTPAWVTNPVGISEHFAIYIE